MGDIKDRREKEALERKQRENYIKKLLKQIKGAERTNMVTILILDCLAFLLKDKL